MRGPKAPKDAEKKREYFYIMREKEIFGEKQPDGKGIQYLYQSDGRLINSAQITGNVDDVEQLELLKDAKGFRKLVHSIGVAVQTQDAKEEVTFVFEMYGKQDLYGGGTKIKATFLGDGAENRINLEDVKWSEDDNVPGQIRVIMQKPEQRAVISVRLYLQDGFCGPTEIQEEKVDFDAPNYRQMIENSLLSMGNPARIKKLLQKAKNGQEVTLGFIGGSITQGAGATPIHTNCYAYQFYERFQKEFGKNGNVKYVKAGVGGTPSELGMIRFERDVLRDGKYQPDLVVVEFAVNDEGDETKGNCYESLVRKILMLPNQPAVLLLFSVFANDENLQERLSPVGYRYHLPMVSIKNAVTPQFRLKPVEGRIISKNQFFYDMYHPTNMGHQIMAECLMELCCKIDTEAIDECDITDTLIAGKPAIGNSFDKVHLMDKKDIYNMAQINCGSFIFTDSVLQSVEMDVELELTPEFPYNWMYDGSKQNQQPVFEMKIICKALLMVFKDSGETDAGCADIYVDGVFVRKADPYENGWLHCNAILLFDESQTKEHIVTVRVCKEDINKKFTILGFGYVEGM